MQSSIDQARIIATVVRRIKCPFRAYQGVHHREGLAEYYDST